MCLCNDILLVNILCVFMSIEDACNREIVEKRAVVYELGLHESRVDIYPLI